MKRLRETPIDDAKYYETVWNAESLTGHWHFDAVRHRALARKVKTGDKVLDVGAGVWGTGQYIVNVLQIPKTSVVAYDQSYTAREWMEQMCPEMIFILGQLPYMPFGPKEFDCVIAGEIIEHMLEPKELAAELCRICRPGGWVTVSTVNTKSANAIRHGPYPEHMWEFTSGELIDMFSPFGKTGYEMVGDYHCIFCNRK